MSAETKSRAAAMAQQFKQKAAKTKPLSPSAEVSLEIPDVFMEDGSPFVFECELRRVDISVLYAGGHLPEYLVNTLISKGISGDSEELKKQAKSRASDLTPKQMNEIFAHQIRVAQFSCVAPKLVFHEPEDESELDMRQFEFSGQIIAAIYAYASNGAPDVPVPTADGGSTTLKAVENFRDDAQGHEPVDAGNGSPESREVRGAADGADG